MDEDRDQNFGEEARNDKDERCTLSGIPPENPQFYRGVIPGRALGLSGGRLLDAWDRQFTYVVVREATEKDSFTSKRWPPIFKLLDQQLRQLNEKNKGIVVIISHGANGSGAYLTDGQQTDPQGEEAGRFEKKNIDADSDFVQAPYSTNERNPFDDQVLVLIEDQIVQPLANQGALKTKHVQTLEKLKRIENALIGFIVAHARDCPGLGEIRIPSTGQDTVPYRDLYLEPSDVSDPWGQPIRYKIGGTDPQNIGCYAGGDYTFMLKSKGPTPGSENDDITTIKRTHELMGILIAAGINPNPSAGTHPTAKE